MSTRLVGPVLAAIFLICLAVFFTAELTPGMPTEGSDWTMYVMHARNIVTGHPYTETHYVFQPESTTELGANAYPAGFPLMLAPFYLVEGMDYAQNGRDLKLFKFLNAMFLVLSLWPAYLYARRTLSGLSSFVIIVALGFSELFFLNFDSIGSDAPYEFFSLLVLLFLLHIYDKGLDQKSPWLWGALAGLSMAGTYVIRPFGLAFMVAVAGAEILRRRRITAFLIAAGVVFVPLVLLNAVLFHSEGGYSHQFTSSIKEIAHHAMEYAGLFSYEFANPVSKLFRYAIWGVTLIFALIGFFQRVRAGLGLVEIYVLTLLAVLCVYWATNARYLLPIMPLYLVYIFEGFQSVAGRLPSKLTLPVKAAAAALLLLAPGANAVLLRPDPKDTLITTGPYEQLCSEIRKQTEPSALLIFWNPRVLGFSTERFASGWPATGKADDVMHYLARVHPKYVVEDKERVEDRKDLIPVLDSAPAKFTTIFENSRFRLTRIQGLD